MISDREPPCPARPNLLAMITSSRLPAFESAAPRNSSLLPPPYISAVSNSVMPASSAALTTSAVSSGPMRMPKLLQPRPSTDTAKPELPTLRISTAEPPNPPCEQCQVQSLGSTATSRAKFRTGADQAYGGTPALRDAQFDTTCRPSAASRLLPVRNLMINRQAAPI